MSEQATALPAFADPRFELKRRLGAGAYGEVFEALDRRHGSRVALKVLTSLEPTALYRFKQEFRALQDLSHPNLVSLYGLFSSPEGWFLTMEYVEGQDFLSYVHPRPERDAEQNAASLGDTLEAQRTVTDIASGATLMLDAPLQSADSQAREAPAAKRELQIDLERLCSALVQLVQGVDALHTAGHLHRDLKPPNVLATRQGRVTVLDFGLVTSVASEDIQASKSIAGTPHYMAPEQAAGAQLSPASDWYAVGVMLFEALTDELPFRGSMLEQLSARQDRDGAPPSSLMSGIPQELDELCAALLRRDPKSRPSSSEILQCLERISPSKAVQPSVAESSSQSSSEHFVGREDELEKLWDAFRSSEDGRATIVEVLGLPGIGKTALVQRFLGQLREARGNVLILRARCYEQESMPYKGIDALVDAISRYLEKLSTQDARALLPVDIHALSLVFPVLKGVKAVASARSRVLQDIDEIELRRRAFEALRELLRRMCMEQSLVLLIDDSQWGDEDSGALLAEMFQSPAPPVLLIATCRSNQAEASPLLRRLRSELETLEGQVDHHELELRALSADDARTFSRQLVEEWGGDWGEERRTSAEALIAESEGNPFLLRELLAGLSLDPGAGSHPLSVLVEKRRQALPPAGRRLLDVIAVAGVPMAEDIAIEAAGSGDESSSALAALRVANLIHTDASGQRLEIYHGRFREELAAILDASQQRSIHRRLVEVLEAKPEPDAEALKRHSLACGDKERACRYASQAAEQAVEALAFGHAAMLYGQALEQLEARAPERLGLLVKRAAALKNAGHCAQAAALYVEASELANEDEVASLQLEAADCWLKSGHLKSGLELIGALLKEVGIHLPGIMGASRRAAILGHIRLQLRGLRYKSRDASTLSEKELFALELLWTFVQPMTWVEPNASYALASRYVRLALDTGHDEHVARSLVCWGSMACSFQPEHPVGARAAALATEASTRSGFAEADEVNAHLYRLRSFFRGDFKDALVASRGAADALRTQRRGGNWDRILTAILYAGCSQWLGHWSDLRDAYFVSLRSSEQTGDIFGALCCAMTYGGFPGIIDDEAEQAELALDSYQERWRDHYELFTYTHTWETIGRAYIPLYDKRPLDTLKLIDERWPALAGSGALDAHVFSAEIRYERVSALVAACYQSSSDAERKRYARAARKTMRKLERTKLTLAKELALLGRGSLAAALGEDDKALSLLKEAEPHFLRREMSTHAAGIRRLRGLLLKGDEGAGLIESAEAEIAAYGARNPAAMAHMLVPGPTD